MCQDFVKTRLCQHWPSWRLGGIIFCGYHHQLHLELEICLLHHPIVHLHCLPLLFSPTSTKSSSALSNSPPTLPLSPTSPKLSLHHPIVYLHHHCCSHLCQPSCLRQMNLCEMTVQTIKVSIIAMSFQSILSSSIQFSISSSQIHALNGHLLPLNDYSSALKLQCSQATCWLGCLLMFFAREYM